MKKLYRSRNNKMLTGLCGGLGEMTNVDANLYRILLVILTIISSGATILIYIIVSIVIPKTPDIYSPYNQYKNYNGNPYQGNPYQPNGYQGPSQGPGPGQGNPYQPPYQDTPYTGANSWQPPNPNTPPTPPPTPPTNTDRMMDDLEKKALRREIEELKKKLDELDKKGE